MRPLADRIRPQSLEGFFGQDHLVGETGIIRKNLKQGFIPSFILWGPPGVGKTTLAGILAGFLDRPFFTLSAVDSGVKQLREVIDKAEKSRILDSGSPLLFIDEIHRFSKSQQDSLLNAVEKGIITLIGATTENPSFEVISPLLSRLQVYRMNPLSFSDLKDIIDRALTEDEHLQDINIQSIDYDALIRFGGGDARRTLNLLEQVIHQIKNEEEIHLSEKIIEDTARVNPINYDKKGDRHYDYISAFIKSVRGGHPDAAIYWMAQMLSGGEDPLFLARRMIILASEDIGLANPNALLLANNCFQAVHHIGMPEARIPLAQTAIYLATSPKSNSAYLAIDKALDKVKNSGTQNVPLHLRNAPTKLMREMGHGVGYKYPHNYAGNFTPQSYLPDELINEKFYEPQNNVAENKIQMQLDRWWKPNQSK